ncbi:MAG: dihydroneopterin aldolase [Porticoccaceae bacterium]|jgi:7,8-dihydroneopterin aldolase/epimerase/oxygenase|nr:dihydroneopterin aldolase [Porticoccaceae bacterium]
MKDKILIRGLKAPTIIGIWDWERKVRQELILDLDLFMDTSQSAAADDFEQAVSYAEVSELALAECTTTSFQLIEALAAHLAAAIFENFSLVEELRLEIKKPGAVPEADYVGIEIYRSRTNQSG